MTEAAAPNVSFVRQIAPDLVAQAIEEALVEDGFYRVMDDELAGALPGSAQAGEREVYFAQVTARWTAVWDAWGEPTPEFPDGDPATSLARGLSAAADGDVLQIFGIGDLWGYFFFRRGLTIDSFASEPRRLGALFPDGGDADRFQGDPEMLAALTGRPISELEASAAMGTGAEALAELFVLLGIPAAVALSARGLSPAERDLVVRLRFGRRV